MTENPFGHLQFGGQTDVGRKRTNNEDDLGLFPEAGVFCVADGMGGGDDGEVASSSTVAAVSAFAAKCVPPAGFAYPFEDVIRLVKESVNEISARICRRTATLGIKSCGSTFVGVCFDATDPSRAMALHAGDSRLYLIRNGMILQITRDHSPAEAVGGKGDDDVNPMFRGMILRAVGVHSTVDLEETPFSIQQGDKLLLCSDGLYRMVDEMDIVKIVSENPVPQDAVAALVAAANENGGVDNITAELIGIGELPPPLVAVEVHDGLSEKIREALPQLLNETPQRTMSSSMDSQQSSERSISQGSVRSRVAVRPSFHFTTEGTSEDPNEDSDGGRVALLKRPLVLGIVAVVSIVLVAIACVLLSNKGDAQETQGVQSHLETSDHSEEVRTIGEKTRKALLESISNKVENAKKLGNFCNLSNTVEQALCLDDKFTEDKFLTKEEHDCLMEMIKSQKSNEAKPPNDQETKALPDTGTSGQPPKDQRKSNQTTGAKASRPEKVWVRFHSRGCETPEGLTCHIRGEKTILTRNNGIELEAGGYRLEWQRPGYEPIKKNYMFGALLNADY